MKRQLTDIEELMATSGVAFGTSGARGLVSSMTDQICYAYTKAFIQHLENTRQIVEGSEIAVAGDHRNSTVRIMTAVTGAITDMGYTPIYCGLIPAPAVACYGLHKKIPSMMVTGSHIPDDRNGIKFNSPSGEILKSDEAGIKKQQVDFPAELFDEQGMFNKPFTLPKESETAYLMYVERYIQFFPKQCLAGKNIGLYQHSSVCRDIFWDILTQLGATVIKLGYSDRFVSVDTEAIRPEDVELAKNWAKEHQFDSIISADGDADRPLTSDENGTWLRGDISGILTAQYLQATVVATPVSSNTAVEKCNAFRQVSRTKIGSPFVIEAMNNALDKTENVMGYEANGGFLIANDVILDSRKLKALPTRDAIIVPLAVLMLAIQQKKTISQLTTALPNRFTTSDRIKEFPTQKSQQRIQSFMDEHGTPSSARIETVFGSLFGRVVKTDTTDGLRISFENDEIVHLRPSGNAPEFRCYNEADSAERATEINKLCMGIVAGWKN
ncbi:Phosphomannomutase [hydrothermal vent metagenome]|uniref:Phosphomannomutase n=1 Tax=hydrothermal vent metagenome TaxID=652676 RepID=A0A3B0ZJZ7_9ZZZZ